MVKLHSLWLPLIFSAPFMHASEGQTNRDPFHEWIVVRLNPNKTSKTVFEPVTFKFHVPKHHRKQTLDVTPAGVHWKLENKISQVRKQYAGTNGITIIKTLQNSNFLTCIDQASQHGFSLDDSLEQNTFLENVRDELDKDEDGRIILDAYINSPKPHTTDARPAHRWCSGCWKALAKLINVGLPY